MEDTDILSQQARIDTMNHKLWYSRGMYEPGFDPVKAAREMYNTSVQLGYETGIARSLINIGLGTFIVSHNVKESLQQIREAQEIFRRANDKRWVANSFVTIGIIENTSGSRKEALYNALKGIDYYEESGDPSSDAVMAYYVVGTVYKDLEKWEEAERYFSTGINLKTDHNNTWSGRIYAGLTGVYTQLGRYDEAITYAVKGLEILRTGGNRIAESRVLTEIGLLYKKQKEYTGALNYFNEGLKLREQSGYEQFKMSSLIEIADLYKETGDPQKAIDHLKQAEEIARSINRDAKLAQICKDIAESYKALSDHQQALAYFEKFMGISAALNKSETEKKIDELKHGILKEKEDEIERLRNVELKNAYDIISERNKEITDSINYARRIQHSVLPSREMLDEQLRDNFLFFKPKDIVSGDFYWATRKVHEGKDYFFLAVADSTGHGVPGACMSILNITFLNEAINEKNIIRPDRVLDHVRERLIGTISRDGGQDGMDCILVCIDLSSGTISYAAANNAPLLIADKTMHHLGADKMPVGKGEKHEHFVLRTITSKKGDILYLYTDGYADQFGGPKGKKFKYKQLDELLLSISSEPMDEQKNVLERRFEAWKGNLEQVDDVCIIGIRL